MKLVSTSNADYVKLWNHLAIQAGAVALVAQPDGSYLRAIDQIRTNLVAQNAFKQGFSKEAYDDFRYAQQSIFIYKGKATRSEFQAICDSCIVYNCFIRISQSLTLISVDPLVQILASQPDLFVPYTYDQFDQGQASIQQALSLEDLKNLVAVIQPRSS